MEQPSGLLNVLGVVLALMGLALVVALVGLFALVKRIRNLQVPREADFFTTMRLVPLELMVLLDLLDFGLDIFAAPITWVVLDRMGLPNLRNKAVIEALVPLSSPIPTFTLCWVAARLFNLGGPDSERLVEYARRARSLRETSQPGPTGRPTVIIDMDEER